MIITSLTSHTSREHRLMAFSVVCPLQIRGNGLCEWNWLELTRWPHGAHDLDVHQVDHGTILHVVPVPVVQPLPQELHGRLGAVRLARWHVYIVHKHHLPSASERVWGGKTNKQTKNMSSSILPLCSLAMKKSCSKTSVKHNVAT